MDSCEGVECERFLIMNIVPASLGIENQYTQLNNFVEMTIKRILYNKLINKYLICRLNHIK